MPRHLIGDAHEWVNEIMFVCLSAIPLLGKHVLNNGGERIPFELNFRSLVERSVGCSVSGRHSGFEIPLLIELFGLT